MNREMRRNKSESGALKYLNTPCTITEATQISRGVAEDVVAEYASQVGHVQVSTSLQLEVIKEILINAGITTEEEIKEKYILRAEEFNRMQEKLRKEAQMKAEDIAVEEEDSSNPKMDIKMNDIEVTKIK